MSCCSKVNMPDGLYQPILFFLLFSFVHTLESKEFFQTKIDLKGDAMTTQSKTTLFREKRANFQPPPVPHELLLDFQNLIKIVINDGTLTLFEKLEGLYDFLDRYNSFVSTFTVCKKGCAHCCQIGVSMGHLEAECWRAFKITQPCALNFTQAL